ncbi:acyl-CoA dehydrogenase family protein [Azospirillum sp. SYSU D00513]|uniref:acyl-CoA dehydrogenase family protein n=1 Tax=Azospirillum sp. SYSU D00513 TaxID=2812561 RepID=UPI001A9608BC|nr:acyl-CoA dehydrogenase family protein [Azospirillum sp. SYSU D00513]
MSAIGSPIDLATDLAPALAGLCDTAAEVARTVLAPAAEAVDREGAWPAAGMAALAASGLTALHIPLRLGGHEQGLLALAVVTEELGRACSSTAMCFGMHSVAAKVLAAKATADQEERFLRPIAEGRHITTLALSEPGTGVHFFLPRARFRPDGAGVDSDGGYVLDGEKSFVTNGGHADSYVVSAVPPGAELDPGAFTCLAVERGAQGLEWGKPWQGFGMRGNSSRSLRLNGVRIPGANLLGAEGDQIWYVFEVVAPYFLIAMAGVYLGIARAALDEAVAHLKQRHHDHTGESLSEIPVLWHQVAQAWTEIEATRQLVRHAARQGDHGAPQAPLALFAAKAKVAETVTAVTETAMMLMGGRGYAESGRIGRLHRDARAAHVMSPTTHLLNTWLGRSLLDLPLL